MSKTRSCHLSAHGGENQCEGEQIQVDWVTFIHDQTDWGAAFFACRAKGGKLFNKLNGTSEQIEFYFQKLGKPQCYWLGLVLVDGEWVMVPDNDAISPDLIVWGDGQPNRNPNENKALVLSGSNNADGVHDAPPDLRCKALCSMN